MLAPMRVSSAPVVSSPPVSAVDFVPTVYAAQTLTATLLYVSPTSTVTPVVVPSTTSTMVPFVVLTPDTLQFALSFYDPHIGAIFPDKADTNCLQFDWVIKDCVSKVNNGQDDYKIWLGKGAACSKLLPYYTKFYVHHPPQLAGLWTCIDNGDMDRNGLHYIDFMLSYPDDIWTGPNLNEFPWSSPVLIQVLNDP